MTDQVRAGVPARRTRRQLLAGGTGAPAAVLTAVALAGRPPARADTGQAVRKSCAASWTNATGTTRVGIFAGTLTSVSPNDSLNLGTVDLRLPGGQITVQGFFFGTQSRIMHAITGGTGTYRNAGGEFSFTSPAPQASST